MIYIGGYTAEDYGVLADVCFTWLTDANRPTGVKMFCMPILCEISEDEPDLKPEPWLLSKILCQKPLQA